jgi:chemotaxis protein CheD
MPRTTANEYYDHLFQIQAVRVAPGDFHATDRPIALVTTLGSCVSACIFDPYAHVGGLNHFLLPEPIGGDSSTPTNSPVYGRPAMDALLAALEDLGARHDRLKARIYGGGKIIPTIKARVGHDNVEFAKSYLAAHGIEILSASVEEGNPRRIYFFPQSGIVMLKKLPPLQPVTSTKARSGSADSIRRAFHDLPPSSESLK